MKNSSNMSTDNWLRFLIIEPISNGALNSLSPFAVHKALQGLAGELKNVKRIKSGRLLVECNKQHNRGISRESVKMRCLKISLLKECQLSRRFIFVAIMNWFRRMTSF